MEVLRIEEGKAENISLTFRSWKCSARNVSGISCSTFACCCTVCRNPSKTPLNVNFFILPSPLVCLWPDTHKQLSHNATQRWETDSLLPFPCSLTWHTKTPAIMSMLFNLALFARTEPPNTLPITCFSYNRNLFATNLLLVILLCTPHFDFSIKLFGTATRGN